LRAAAQTPEMAAMVRAKNQCTDDSQLPKHNNVFLVGIAALPTKKSKHREIRQPPRSTAYDVSRRDEGIL